MHHLLERQLRRYLGDTDGPPGELAELLKAIDAALTQSDADRAAFERALVTSSQDLQRANAETRALLQQTQAILDAAGEGIYGLDLQGKATFVNPSAARMLGQEKADILGRSMHELIHHTRRDGSPYPADECPAVLVARGANGREVIGEVFWRKDGSSFPVEYITTPIRDARGALTGSVVTFNNVERRQRLESQLAQAQKLESIGQLAAGIAHEVNTPIQFIGDNLRFLDSSFGDLRTLVLEYRRLVATCDQDDVLAAPVKAVRAAEDAADVSYLVEEMPQAIAQSLEGVERVAKIVQAMKEFSHPGTEEKALVDLNRAVQSTITIARNEWKYVADMETTFDPELPLVPAYPGDFNQVVLNLIINAAQAIASALGGQPATRGLITVATRCDGPWAELRVGDTGTGIPEEIRPRIFDPFFTTKAVGKGTGQGLAISHAVVVDKHGGTIDVESARGRGTTFIVRIPLARTKAA